MVGFYTVLIKKGGFGHSLSGAHFVKKKVIKSKNRELNCIVSVSLHPCNQHVSTHNVKTHHFTLLKYALSQHLKNKTKQKLWDVLIKTVKHLKSRC